MSRERDEKEPSPEKSFKTMNKITLVIAVVALLIGIVVLVEPANILPLSGLIHNVQESFDGGIAVNGQERISGTAVLVEGGSDTTLTAGATVTITAAQICDASILSFEASGVSSSTTLPTVTTLVADCFKTDGDAKTMLFRNTGSAASTTVMVAGANMVMLEPDGQNVVIAGANSVLIHLFRTSATEMVVDIDEMIDAD